MNTTPVRETNSIARRTRAFVCTLLVIAAGLAPSARAADGCAVLLCLASPGGPMTYAACAAPITALFKSLALGDPFPSCATAGTPGPKSDPAGGTGTYAMAMAANYYDRCPAGTSALPSGAVAIASPNGVPANNTPAWLQQQTLYTGIGDGAKLTPPGGSPTASLPPEICVAGAPLGSIQLGVDLRQSGLPTSNAAVYSAVTILQANTSPRVIGVWVNGALANQVHW